MKLKVMLFLLLSWTICDQLRCEDNGLIASVRLTSPAGVIRRGDKFSLTATITNNSERIIKLQRAVGRDIDFLHYRISIINENGEAVPRIDHPDLYGWSDILVDLPPHIAVEESLLLTKIFDLSLAGAYEITVERQVLTDSGAVTLQSNKFRLKVK